MKLKSLLIAAIFIVAMSAHAEPIVVQRYAITSVQELSASGGVTLEITQGNSESLRVEATADVMRRVKVDLTNHRLTVKVKNENGGLFGWLGDSNDKVKFILQVKHLSEVDLSGAVQLEMASLQSEKLVVKMSGAAQAHFSDLKVNALVFESSGAATVEIEKLNSQTVAVNLSGASNFKVNKSGAARMLKVDLSGACNYHSKSLIVSNADVHASGASHIEIFATETIKAEASGASHIDYYGSAKVTSNSSGASHINGHE
jgi:hypothetical protein